MTLPEASLKSPLRLTVLDVLPDVRWSWATDIAERSRSGAGNEGVVPTEEGVGGACGVFGKWAETGVIVSRVTESNTSPGPENFHTL